MSWSTGHRGARARFLSPPPPTGPGPTTFFTRDQGGPIEVVEEVLVPGVGFEPTRAQSGLKGV